MPYARWLLLLLLVVQPCASGCRSCYQLATRSRLTVDGPVDGNVVIHQPPTAAEGPMLEMSLDGSPLSAHAPRIAVVDIDGPLFNMNLTGLGSLGENPVGMFHEKLSAVAAQPQVAAVVLRINSPGGSVAATDLMAHELARFRGISGVPVVACLMDLGTGGAYYLAAGADRIVALPTTVTGGIGVIINLFNLRETMATINILGQSVKAGEYIDVGTSTDAMTDEGRAMVQQIADQFHQRFIQQVRMNRPVAPAAEVFDGRILTGPQAMDAGLVDRVGYLDDALQLARDQAGCPQARAVIYHRREDKVRSPYAITPNVPLQGNLFPISLPGLDRSRLPTFLYMWQPDPTLERLGGR